MPIFVKKMVEKIISRKLSVRLNCFDHWFAGKDYRSLLKDIKTMGDTHILLDCKTESIHDILKQAQQVKLLQRRT